MHLPSPRVNEGVASCRDSLEMSPLVNSIEMSPFRVDVSCGPLFVFVEIRTEAKPCFLGRSGSAYLNERPSDPSL